jgi:hypothetical protein
MIDWVVDINAAEEEWGRAAIDADEAALQRCIADDAILFHGSGNVEDKAPFIANLFRRLEFELITRDDVRIRQLAPTVVVASGLQTQRVRSRGSDDSFHVSHATISRLWVMREGRWQMANYHSTRLANRK